MNFAIIPPGNLQGLPCGKSDTEPKDTHKNGYRQVTRREENLSFFMPGIVKTKAKKEARSQQIRGFFSGNPSFFRRKIFNLKAISSIYRVTEQKKLQNTVPDAGSVPDKKERNCLYSIKSTKEGENCYEETEHCRKKGLHVNTG